MDRTSPPADIVGFLVSKISGFAQLRDNWDGCCAFPVAPSAVHRAVGILRVLRSRGLLEGQPPFEAAPRKEAGEGICTEIGYGGMEIGATREGGIRFDWNLSGSRFTVIVPPTEEEGIYLEDARLDETSGRFSTSSRTTSDLERLADLLEAALGARG